MVEVTLAEAAARFLASLDAQERAAAQTEVNRFVHWCGADRPLPITLQEISNYSDLVTSSTTDPFKALTPVRQFLSYVKKVGLVQVSLATHVRVKKVVGRATRKPAKAQGSSPVVLTAEGYAALQSQLNNLKGERPKIAQELQRARADKDFRENAPLDAARDWQGHVEARIRELETTLDRATIIEQMAAELADVGSTVHLMDLATGEGMEYTLVHPQEVDPSRGLISIVSPLGRALEGRAQGEMVEVEAPIGKLSYRIERIAR